MPVPPAVDDLLAARGYINPLTAMLMLKRWPVAGKHLVLTAASSSCASLLGQWALAMGARSVSGIIRSPQHRARLEQAGIYPILDTDRALMEKVSQHSDLRLTRWAANWRIRCCRCCPGRRPSSPMGCYPGGR